MKSKILASLLFLTGALANSQAATLFLDFGAAGTPVATGFTAVNATAFHAIESPVVNLGGGITLSFSSVDNYSTDNALNPLVTDGWFVTSGQTFTLSGLNPGDSISLYAISAWDGAGRAAMVSLNGLAAVNSYNANLYTTPSTSPTLSDMTLIASNQIVDGTGIMNGTLGVSTAEGQLGGFAIVITPVPEPSTYALLGLGLVSLVVLRRRATVKA